MPSMHLDNMQNIKQATLLTAHSFLKMMAVGKTGGQLTTYSDRFSYSGMKGTWDPAVKKGLADISGTSGPAAEDKTVKPGVPAGDPVGAASDFEVPYTMQTGLFRYAPMQPVPGKSVTAKGNPKPLYPTSSVSIATARLPIPKIEKTITQSQTYSVQSRENTVCLIKQLSSFALCLHGYAANSSAGCSGAPCHRRHGQVPQSLEGLDILRHCQMCRYLRNNKVVYRSRVPHLLEATCAFRHRRRSRKYIIQCHGLVAGAGTSLLYHSLLDYLYHYTGELEKHHCRVR
jgi:hypothetical protein